MLISIVIPAYNSARIIEDCIRSLELQTFDDFEVIVIDDGSTDGTASLLDANASRLDFFHYERISNSGPLLARKHGIEIAKGDYILLLDADDTLRADALELFATLISTYSPDIIQFGYSFESDYSRRSHAFNLNDGLYTSDRLKEFKAEFYRGRMNSVWSRLVRADILNSDFPYDQFYGIRHGEDMLFSAWTIQDAKRVVVTNEALYYYRINAGASTASYKSKQLQDLELVCSALLNKVKECDCKYLPEICTGTSTQYAYLVNILLGTPFSKQQKMNYLAEIGHSFERVGGEDLLKRSDALRIDCLVMLQMLQKGNLKTVRFFFTFLNRIRGLFLKSNNR